MSTFISGFVKGYGEAQDRKLKREMFLSDQQEKKSRALGAVLPKVQEFQEKLATTKTRMEYLEGRGLDEKTLNVLYSDPEALSTAYDLLSTEGADWDPETVSTYVRSAATTKIPDVSWEEHLTQSFDWFSGLDMEAMTPESVLSGMAGLQPDPVGVAEFKPVPKAKNDGEPGISATQARTWEAQQTVFNSRMVQVGQSYLNSLLDNPNADPAEIAQVQEDLANYGKSENSTMRMYDKFGDTVLENLRTTIRSPDALAGLEENPYLFVDTPDGKGFNPEGAVTTGPQGPEGGTLIATGIDPADGMMTYFYRLPDGSTVPVKE